MPANTLYAPSFDLDTDYPLDKVIYIASGSGSISGSSDIVFPHGLPFAPMTGFYWSLTPDFSVIYENNVGPFPSGNPSVTFTLQVAIEADATNVTLRGNGILGSTTIYYRVFGFQPDDLDENLSSTSNQADQFILNTDYNYLKLLTADNVTLAAGASTTITHNLGYKPQVTGWFQYLGTIYPLQFVSLDPTGVAQNSSMEITDTTLVLYNGPILPSKFYYRIYLDS